MTQPNSTQDRVGAVVTGVLALEGVIANNLVLHKLGEIFSSKLEEQPSCLTIYTIEYMLPFAVAWGTGYVAWRGFRALYRQSWCVSDREEGDYDE